MEKHGDEVHVETDEARGGSTPHIVRWILAISLLAAIALLSVIWITGAASQHESEPAAEVRERVLNEYSARRGVLAQEGTQPAASPQASDTAQAAATPAAQN